MKILYFILVSTFVFNSVLHASTHKFLQPPFILQETNAQLNAAVLTDGQAAEAWFEWSREGGPYATSTPTNISASSAFTRVSFTITNFAPGTYTCRLAVSNAKGVSYSNARKFTSGGKVLAWGSELNGAIDVPPGLTNIVSVCGGGSHSLALKPNGQVVGWGKNDYGQANPPASLTNAVALAAGFYRSLALKSDGTVISWGSSLLGRPATNIAAIATCGSDHTMMVRWNGTVFGRGLINHYGEQTVPASATNVVAVANGLFHTMALRIDGSVICWGAGTAGKSGNPHFGQSIVPAGLTNVVAIAANYYGSMALKGDGTIVSWGQYPSTPPSTNEIIAIAAGESTKIGLKADGTVLSWGGGASVPPNVLGVTSIACGAQHVLGIGSNAAPVAAPQSVTVVPRQEATIYLYGLDANRDALKFRILSLPMNGTLFQLDAGTKASPITTPDTELLDSSGAVLFVTPDDALPSSSSFSYSVSDGEFEASPETVTVEVVHANPPVFTSVSKSFFTFSGTSNVLYRVWASTNLSNWESLGPASVHWDGTFYFVDDAAGAGVGQRFYRISAP